MRLGRVYCWNPTPQGARAGAVSLCEMPLERLESSSELSGVLVKVKNGGYVRRVASNGIEIIRPIGNARADRSGDFLFQPGIGGGRMDIAEHPDREFIDLYIQASRFGEVNTYYHLDLIANYVDELLSELRLPTLPRILAVVNAHCGVQAMDPFDGVRRVDRRVAFQGGHYRLPSAKYDVPEHGPLLETGEIHLGPGRQYARDGALVDLVGGLYRANASHNAGILYHEYGHHICRHLADFRGNALVDPQNQNNRKTPIDEGTCDYWAAAMLGSPHIWALHHNSAHPRNLLSGKTFADYDSTKGADPHTNGTIWAAALWRLRAEIAGIERDGSRAADKLVLQALAFMGQKADLDAPDVVKAARRARRSFAVGAETLLEADEALFSGRHADAIRQTFANAGIELTSPGTSVLTSRDAAEGPVDEIPSWVARELGTPVKPALTHVLTSEVPETEDLLTAETLSERLIEASFLPFSAIFAGDLMLGGRAAKPIEQNGADYPFEAVTPLLTHADVVCANLEGPFARIAEREQRNHSYKVDPALAHTLRRAWINVVSLANNHLLDCGREGVLETLAALKEAEVTPIGGGADRCAAHQPHLFDSHGLRIGLLSYYWNKRTAADDRNPGSAIGDPLTLEQDLRELKAKVDRAVVVFHWGQPYESEPFQEDRELARLAVDCGADLVVGHHSHVIQPFELYRGVPIFYSIGNFAFGSGNSKGEGMLLGVRFMRDCLSVGLFPLYVKNRDPRVNYQPKVLSGASAERILRRFAEQSGDSGRLLDIGGFYAELTLKRVPFRMKGGAVA